MSMRRFCSVLSLPSCLVFILSLAWGAAIAQQKSPVPAMPLEPQSYRSGLKSIVIPSPTADLSEIGPDYRVLKDALVPNANRLLAAFLTAEDAANVRTGASKGLSRYALVENQRRGEFEEVNADVFKQIADGIATKLGGGPNASNKDMEDEINRKLKALRGADAAVTLDKPIQLGAFFSKPNACGFGTIQQVSTAAGTSAKMVGGMMALRVQNRLLFAYVYSVYKDEDSVEWVRRTSEQWADAMLKAN